MISYDDEDESILAASDSTRRKSHAVIATFQTLFTIVIICSVRNANPWTIILDWSDNVPIIFLETCTTYFL